MGRKKKELKQPIKQVYVLSTFTADPIEPYLGIRLSEKRQTLNITFGPYNQILQQLSDDHSPVYEENTDAVVVWIRIEDYVEKQMLEGPADFDRCLEDAEILAESVRTAARKADKKIIFVLPAKPETKPAGFGDLQILCGMEMLSEQFRNTLMMNLCGQKNVLICDAEEAIREISVKAARDPVMYAIAKIPYTDLLFETVAGQIVKVMRLPDADRKILLFDASMLVSDEYDVDARWDHVSLLTGTEIGRDDSIHAFQSYINMLIAWGTEIALCTAMDEKQFLSMFSDKDILIDADKIKHICYLCKSMTDAINEVAESVGIAAEKVVPVTPRTDGADEKSGDILVLTEDRAFWADVINQSDYISHIPETSCGIRKEAKKEKVSFYSRLELKTDLRETVRDQQNQILHLMESVKDFRYTNEIWDIDKIDHAFDSSDIKMLGVYVKDRFGDYGMAGLVVGKIQEDVFHITDFMLNCRILGKLVEYHVIVQLAAFAKKWNCNAITMKFVENDRNIMSARFIAEILEKDFDQVRTGKEFLSSCEELENRAKLKINESGSKAEVKDSAEIQASAAELLKKKWNVKNEEMKNRIIQYASGINTVDDLMNKINSTHASVHISTCEYVEPRTETEKKLADLWSEILHVEKVGVLDNFFMIGGTSILATQLIVKFKDVFNVDLPVRIFFDKSNIEQMALFIDAMAADRSRDRLNADAVQNYRFNTREFLRREAALDESIRTEGLLPKKSAAESKNVFVTGATGFLGAFLLADILNKTTYMTYCLVRAKDEENGLERIKSNLSKYSIWNEEFSKRIVVICGDMSLPLLGLELGKFQYLAQTVDMIYHCAANTNFLQPYSMLKAANVGGTQEILRLASTFRLKIVHFVSTLYVFSNITNPDGCIKYEDEIPTCNEVLVMGYQQTKMISEQIIAIARERGIPVNIYRTGRISGSTDTGACQTGDYVWMAIKCCVESGLMFSEKVNIELIPVDYVSSAIVQLSKEPSALNRNFHICNRTKTPIDFITGWMDKRGFKVEKYAYTEWTHKLTELVATHKGMDSVRAILPFLTEEPTLEKNLIMDTKNIDEVLKNSGVVRTEVDPELFAKYVDYFIKIGYFNIDR